MYSLESSHQDASNGNHNHFPVYLVQSLYNAIFGVHRDGTSYKRDNFRKEL